MPRKRNEYPTHITPKGTVIWASLHEADFEYKDEGEFHVRLRFDPENPDLEPLIEKAQAILDEAFEEKKEQLTREKKGALLKKLNKQENILTEEVDRESGDPTGFVTLRSGMKHRIEIKNGPKAGTSFEKTPDVFDATGKKLKRAPKVGSGSELKVSVRIMDYFMAKDATVGVRFELEGVQIIKLVQGGERSASSYGFGQEEGDAINEDDYGFGDSGTSGGYEGGDDAADDNADF